MLKEFSIKNFKSINKEVTLSMEADVERVSEHPTHIVNIRNNSLLKICSMYGPNGGGKSNILKALNILHRIVAFQHIRDGVGDYSCVFSDDDVCEFTSFFATPNHDIGYVIRFSSSLRETPVDDERVRLAGLSVVTIASESIYLLNEKTGNYEEFCTRDINGIIHTDNEAIAKIINDKSLGSSMSVLRFFYEYFYNENITPSTALSVVFELYNEIMSIIPFSNSNIDRRNALNSTGNIVNENKEQLIKLLDAADIHISDIIVEKDGPFSRIYFIRDINVNGNTVQKAIELSEESMGTQKIFNLLTKFLFYRDQPVIFLGDDINAYLHPKLLGAVIELFNSDKNIKCQLIFNSHDITNMNNRLFRRDEIWFVYRDDNYQTEMIPLSNITNYKGKQIRNDASYGKQYLEGKYGADPFIEKGLNWNE